MGNRCTRQNAAGFDQRDGAVAAAAAGEWAHAARHPFHLGADPDRQCKRAWSNYVQDGHDRRLLLIGVLLDEQTILYLLAELYILPDERKPQDVIFWECFFPPAIPNHSDSLALADNNIGESDNSENIWNLFRQLLRVLNESKLSKVTLGNPRDENGRAMLEFPPRVWEEAIHIHHQQQAQQNSESCSASKAESITCNENNTTFSNRTRFTIMYQSCNLVGTATGTRLRNSVQLQRFHLTEIILFFCPIDRPMVEKFAIGLRCLPCLSKLVMAYCALDDAMLQIILQNLCQTWDEMEMPSLSARTPNGEKKKRTTKTRLKELVLCGNKLSDDSLLHLAWFLSQQGTSLRSLNLLGNQRFLEPQHARTSHLETFDNALSKNTSLQSFKWHSCMSCWHCCLQTQVVIQRNVCLQHVRDCLVPGERGQRPKVVGNRQDSWPPPGSLWPRFLAAIRGHPSATFTLLRGLAHEFRGQ